MKVLERFVDGLIRQLVSINDSQFGFVLGRGTTDAIFVVRRLQEKYPVTNKTWEGIWLSTWEGHLVDAENVVWRSGLCDWCRGCMQMRRAVSMLVRGTVKSLKVGVHQGSVLSPLLFIIVLEALSREFCYGVPWADLYAHDLVIIAELLEECPGGSWLGKKQWRRKDWE